MSVTYTAMAIFGVYFNSVEEAEQLLAEHGLDYESDSIEADMIGLEAMNAYTGDTVVLGIEMQLGDTFEKYQLLWDEKLPGIGLTPQGILEVKTG